MVDIKTETKPQNGKSINPRTAIREARQDDASRAAKGSK